MMPVCLFDLHVCLFVCLFDAEERARIYSSDSDEGSDEDKAQRLMKAKKLDSDEVRRAWGAGHVCQSH